MLPQNPTFGSVLALPRTIFDLTLCISVRKKVWVIVIFLVAVFWLFAEKPNFYLKGAGSKASEKISVACAYVKVLASALLRNLPLSLDGCEDLNL